MPGAFGDHDRRLAPLKLTKKGRGITRRLADPLIEVLQTGLKETDEKRLEELRIALVDIANVLDTLRIGSKNNIR